MPLGLGFMRGGRLFFAIVIAIALAGTAQVGWCASVGASGFAIAKKQPVCGGCHKGGEAPQISLKGPDEVAPGSWNPYELVVKNPGQKAGGFDLAVSAGKLISWTLRVKPNNGELVHIAPIPREKDGSVLLEFDWIAPKETGMYAITAAIASVNQDGTPMGDGVVVFSRDVRVSGNALDAKDAQTSGGGVAGQENAAADANDKTRSGKQPPVANLSAPSVGVVGETLYFNGTGSSDPDGGVASFEWDFGDDSSGQLPIGNHVYAEAGSYTVTLKVTDKDGLSSSDHVNITIQDPRGNHPPTANAGGPYYSGVGKPVKFFATASKDPDGRIESYAWDFGDGESAAGTVVEHTYFQAGAYTARLLVKDDKGLPGNAAVGVNIRAGAEVIVGKFNVSKLIEIVDDGSKGEDIVVKSVLQGAEGDHSECGKAYLLRNDAVHQQQVVCYKGEEPSFSTFPVKYSAKDAPEVHWSTYVELDSGGKSEPSGKKTTVQAVKSR